MNKTYKGRRQQETHQTDGCAFFKSPSVHDEIRYLVKDEEKPCLLAKGLQPEGCIFGEGGDLTVYAICCKLVRAFAAGVFARARAPAGR